VTSAEREEARIVRIAQNVEGARQTGDRMTFKVASDLFLDLMWELWCAARTASAGIKDEAGAP
jgi:hypothetical protein